MMEKLLFLPPLASEAGRQTDALIVNLHYLMIAMFFGWLAYFAYVLWRFHQKRNPKASYLGVRSHASSWIEGATTLAETGILVGLALPFWSMFSNQFPKEEEATIVKVSAQQFGWNFLYAGPDGKFGKQDMKFVTSTNPFGLDFADPATKDNITVLNEMRVPVGKPVIAYMSSKDVIHSFKLPNLRVTQDCIPGLAIPIHFKPTVEGNYQIYCAQLCGNGHAAMSSGRLMVENDAKFQTWMRSKTGATAADYE
jgi:cytochrome c oxidase subunit 2